MRNRHLFPYKYIADHFSEFDGLFIINLPFDVLFNDFSKTFNIFFQPVMDT